jgi:Cu(I)/Ag(I) efflux system membrane protein CusA/SilA
MGVSADIMSLGGIAIAIGAMIDAAIVMIENMHKRLEQHTERAAEAAPSKTFDSATLSPAERWQIVTESCKEVGPALFFSLLIITVSFVPVFALEGQEGRLFKPLAFTKTFAMAAASILAVTLVPVTMGLFVRGRIRKERANPINRLLHAVYRPVLAFAMRRRWPVLSVALTALILTWLPFSRIGSEFMPPLNEGSLLFMPTTLPGVTVARAREVLRVQDSILMTFPEVKHVWGKAGRANTATDPAGLDMFETTIMLESESEWREGVTVESLISEMDSAVRMAGIANSWTMPIKGRIDMLATGIRTPVGIKVFGPDLAELERLAKAVEQSVLMVPGTRSAFAERAVSGYYLDIDIDRAAAARHGINVGDVQMVIATAIGGMTITQTVEGRERYAVRVRYPLELRDTPEKLASVLIPVAHGIGVGNSASDAMSGGGGMGGGSETAASGMPANGAAMGGGAMSAGQQVPLGQIATIIRVAGPMVVRTENAVPTAWVYVDVAGRDIGGYVAEARAMVERDVIMPAGYTLQWSGQYEYMMRAKERLQLVVPATLLVIFLLLYLNFRTAGDTIIVMASLPFALIGGVWLIWLLGYNWSVAVVIGLIALAGVASETGVVMLLFLNHSWKKRNSGVTALTQGQLHDSVMAGAVERLRPMLMTVTAVMAGLLPILWSEGAGASVMKRIAAPMIGGMLSASLLTLLVIPVVYSLWKERLTKSG